MDAEVRAALTLLRDTGHVVLKEKSYRQAQERQRVAEALRRAEADAAEQARKWAINCLDEQRRLAERLTYLYGLAASKGATQEELLGPEGRSTRVAKEARTLALHDALKALDGHNFHETAHDRLRKLIRADEAAGVTSSS